MLLSLADCKLKPPKSLGFVTFSHLTQCMSLRVLGVCHFDSQNFLGSFRFTFSNKLSKIYGSMVFFFRESFNLWRLLLMIAFYHQTKTPINFWWKQELNPISLIQLSKALLVELIRTYLWINGLIWARHDMMIDEVIGQI